MYQLKTKPLGTPLAALLYAQAQQITKVKNAPPVVRLASKIRLTLRNAPR